MQRLLCAGSLVSLGSLVGCGGSIRVGPQALASHHDIALQGQATAVVGLADWQPPEIIVGIPATLSAGRYLNGDHPVTQLETGIEVTRMFSGGPFGFRLGPRIGGALAGPGGLYVGARGGPIVSLVRREKGAATPTLTLEGLVGAGVGGAVSSDPMFGAALTIGWDYFGDWELRVPAGRPLRDDVGTEVAVEIEIRGPRAMRSPGDAAGWLRDACMEHASVAAFRELGADLAALDAPEALLVEVGAAAEDEIRHARISFALASRFLGRDVRGAPLTVPSRPKTLDQIATASLLDGAFGESLAAAVLGERARMATPRMRKVLLAIAQDEAKHAELGWKVVDFCIARGASRIALVAAWSRHPRAGASAAVLDALDRRVEALAAA